MALGSAILGWANGIRLSELGHISLLVLSPLSLLVLLLVGAFGLGAIILCWLGFDDRQEPEFYLFTIALGFGVLGHLMLGLGALHLFYPVVAWGLLLISLISSLWEVYRHRLFYANAWGQADHAIRLTWFSGFLLFMIVLGLCYPLWTDALAPPLSWDELAYHLPIPQMYIKQHGLMYISFIPYANWPLEFEMLFTLSLLLASATLAHLLSWTALVLICVGLYLLGRRFFHAQVGLVAAAIFATTPMVGILAGTALIELPLTLYTFLAMYTFLLWIEKGAHPNFLLSASYAGLAASIKMNAAVTAALLGGLLCVALLRKRQPFLLILKQFMLYGLVALMVVAPWYVKSWVFTGNPLWPFGQPWLGAKDWDALGSEYLFGYIRVTNTPLTPFNWLLNLWRVTTPSGMFGPPRMTLGWLYLVLLALAIPALLFACRRQKLLGWLALLMLVFYTAWFFQTHQTRFLLPVTPIFALVAATAAGWLWQSGPWSWRLLVQGALCIALFATSWPAVAGDRARFVSRWPYISGQVSEQDFLRTQISGYSAYDYANQQLPATAKVLLLLYESRGYYLDRDYAWVNPISQRVLRLEEFSNAGQLAAELHKQGFTHLFFNRAQVEQYRFIRYGNAITELSYALLASHARLLYQVDNLEVYALMP